MTAITKEQATTAVVLLDRAVSTLQVDRATHIQLQASVNILNQYITNEPLLPCVDPIDDEAVNGH